MKTLFQGKQVKLANFCEADFAFLENAQWETEVIRNLAFDTINVYTAEDWRKSLTSENNQSFIFAIRLLETEQFLGYVFLEDIQISNHVAELGIALFAAESRGKGYGTEAIGLMLDFAFMDLNLHRVSLSVNSNNAAAIHTYEKVGFVQEGVIREGLFQDGQWLNRLNYGILAEEWRGKRK